MGSIITISEDASVPTCVFRRTWSRRGRLDYIRMALSLEAHSSSLVSGPSPRTDSIEKVSFSMNACTRDWTQDSATAALLVSPSSSSSKLRFTSLLSPLSPFISVFRSYDVYRGVRQPTRPNNGVRHPECEIGLRLLLGHEHAKAFRML